MRSTSCMIDTTYSLIPSGRPTQVNVTMPVAVHRPYEIGERGQQAFGQGAAEAGALLRQIEGQIGQSGAMARPFAFGHFFGRFFVLFYLAHNSLYINGIGVCNVLNWPVIWPVYWPVL
jgi:hypothetical protein